MRKEYEVKLENIRSYYETGAHKPNLTKKEMIEILIDNELSKIDEFHGRQATNEELGKFEEYYLGDSVLADATPEEIEKEKRNRYRWGW